MSAARAFLKPARSRANLRVIVNALVDRVIFEDGSAAGVRATVDGVETVYRCAGEVMLSAGAIATPLILQRSGVGDGAMLRALGIDVAVDAPGVGAHLLDHRLMMVRYDMAVPHSDNAALRGLRLAGNVARYYLTHRGPMAAGYGTVGAFARVMPDARTPDIEMLLAPVVADTDVHGRFVPDRGHSFEVFGYPLRSRSEGSVCIASPDPAIPPIIRPAYLADAYDRSVTVAMHRYIRRWMTMPALRSMVGAEREPARSLETDEQILEAFRTQGQSGCHGCGTCRMGDFNDAVLDPALRVKGVGKLRVVDGSIIPAMVSANTNATIMASAWRAADLILGER
jgi:choline dehydrogenase-like flavoprotein